MLYEHNNENFMLRLNNSSLYILKSFHNLRGAMGGISVILVKNNFFDLLNKYNLHTIIYESLKFQTSITVVQSFIRPYVNF